MKRMFIIVLMFIVFVACPVNSNAQDFLKRPNIGSTFTDTDNPVVRKIQFSRADMLEERYKSKSIKKIKVLTSKITELSLNAGMLLCADKNYTSAESELRYCLQENPKKSEAMLYLAISIFENKGKLSAERLFECIRLLRESRNNNATIHLIQLSRVYESILLETCSNLIDEGLKVSNEID